MSTRNILVSFWIGTVGGSLFAFGDVSYVLYSNTILPFSFSDFWAFLPYPFIIYAVFGGMVMIFLSLCFLTADKIGRVHFHLKEWISFQSGIMVLVTTAPVMDYYFQLDSNPDILKIGCAVLVSLTIASIVGFSVYGLIKWLNPLKVVVFGLLGLTCFSLLFSAWLSDTYGKERRGHFRIPSLSSIPTTPMGAISKKPNILWIVMDTTRADHFSCYGYPLKTTPHLDRLASEGVLYQNAISTCPWTFPSHYAMFTGLYPFNHDRYNELHPIVEWLPPSISTIPMELKRAGYYTSAFSNNFYSVTPAQGFGQGFDMFMVISDRKTIFTEVESRLQLTRLFSLLKRIGTVDIQELLSPIRKFFTPHSIDAGSAKTNQWVKKYLRSVYRLEQPFFIFINFMELHDPYGKTPDARYFLHEKPSNIYKFYQRLYDGDLFYLDGKIGELVDDLKKLGIWDNTLVIITADHGEGLGEHDYFGHIFTISHMTTHVPLIIHYPPLFPPGTKVKHYVQTIDIFPTLLDVIGQEKNTPPLQGYSLLGHDHPAWTISVAFFGTDWKHWIKGGGRTGMYQSLHSGDYEVLLTPQGEKLYNIKEDPLESKDLFQKDPKRSSLLKAFLIHLVQHFKR